MPDAVRLQGACQCLTCTSSVLQGWSLGNMQMFLDKLQWRQSEVGRWVGACSTSAKLARTDMAPLDGRNADRQLQPACRSSKRFMSRRRMLLEAQGHPAWMKKVSCLTPNAHAPRML